MVECVECALLLTVFCNVLCIIMLDPTVISRLLVQEFLEQDILM